MKITFLGTGTSQGIPILTCNCEICKSNDERDKRLRTSVNILHKGISINIDAGPDFRTQMLRAKINKLDAVLLTHSHHDHVAGLDDIRAYNYSQKKAMSIYGNNHTLLQIERYFDYSFGQNKYPGVPEFNLIEIDENNFFISSVEIVPIKVFHGEISILGFRIENVAYLTDVSYIPDYSLKKLQNLDLLIINGLRFEQHHSHFSIPQVLKIVENIKPKKTFLTHISHRAGLHSKLLEILPQNVEPAYDNLIYEFKKNEHEF